MDSNDTVEALTRRLVEYYRAGAIDDALAVAMETVRRHPESSMAWTNLGLVHLRRNDAADARHAYERALALNASNDEARRGLAVAKHYAGEVATGDSVSTAPRRDSGAVNVLALVSVREGNIVTEALFDDASMRVIRLAVELHPADEPLPPHDVAFNILGDADVSEPMLKRAERLLQSSRIVINAPSTVLGTGRAKLAERLRSVPNVVTPKIALMARENVPSAVTTFPVLLRSPGFHNGEHFELVSEPHELNEVLGRLPGDEIFAIEFLDTRDGDGNFAKYRVMTIGGTLYPIHLAISQQWKVHYVRSDTPGNPSFQARERVFLTDMERSIGTRAAETLRELSDVIGLDYGGIDFGLDPQGRVVVFEANATMALRHPTDADANSERASAITRAIAAVREMLLDRARA